MKNAATEIPRGIKVAAKKLRATGL